MMLRATFFNAFRSFCSRNVRYNDRVAAVKVRPHVGLSVIFPITYVYHEGKGDHTPVERRLGTHLPRG